MGPWPYADAKQPATTQSHDFYSHQVQPAMSSDAKHPSSYRHDSAPGSSNDGSSSRRSPILGRPLSPRKQQDRKQRLSVPSTFMTADTSLSPPAPPAVQGTYQPIGFRCRANNGIATKQPIIPRLSTMASQIASRNANSRISESPATNIQINTTTMPPTLSMAASDRISNGPNSTRTHNRVYARRHTDVGFDKASRALIRDLPNQRSTSFTESSDADPKAMKEVDIGRPLHRQFVSFSGQSRHIPRPIRSGRYNESPNTQTDDKRPSSSKAALKDYTQFLNNYYSDSALDTSDFLGESNSELQDVGPLDTNDEFTQKDRNDSTKVDGTLEFVNNCVNDENKIIQSDIETVENEEDEIGMLGEVRPSDLAYVDHYLCDGFDLDEIRLDSNQKKTCENQDDSITITTSQIIRYKGSIVWKLVTKSHSKHDGLHGESSFCYLSDQKKLLIRIVQNSMEEEPPLDYSEDPEIEVAPVSTTSSIDVRSILKASAT